MSRLFGKVFFASLALTSLAANVQAIDYVESGDFPNISDFGAGAVSVGTLELGTNSIVGDLDGECSIDTCSDPFAGDTADSFTATVPRGMIISSVIVTTSNVIGPDGFSATIYGRSPTTHNIIPASFIVLDGTSRNLAVKPIGEGEYSLSVYGQASEQPGPFSFDWTMYIEVEEEGILFAGGFETGDTSEWSFVVGN